MRKPRVLIFDDHAGIVRALEEFFTSRGYEVFSFTEPVGCPLYGGCEDCCNELLPCADIVITDFRMPRMTGIELLQRQAQRGCKLDIRNKAVMSASMHAEKEKAITDSGCAFLHKAALVPELLDWLSEREKHFDLSRPLGDLAPVVT